MKDNKKVVLKTLVGSHAHGLAGPDSDYDYRSVYVLPTAEILSLGYTYKGTSWIEGEKEDATAWELGHFLLLATKCNPTIMECFVAPRVEDPLNPVGSDLVALFPYLWTPQQAFDAFVGYGLNQRRKLLDNHLGRWCKYGTAYIRTLVNLIQLLQTGTFSLLIPDEPIKDKIIQIRNGKLSPSEIVDIANQLTITASRELSRYKCGEKKQEQDLVKVNDFLIRVRRMSFSGEL